MHALHTFSLATAQPGVDRMPATGQLAALGAVLCLYPASTGGELAGWTRAVRVEAVSGLDSDGLDGQLRFFDAQGACCWRLFLLPDSDFLAWETLIAGLPAACDPRDAGIGERLWRRVAAGLSARRWQGSVLRLSRGPVPGTAQALRASLATVSSLGAMTAARIARREGAANAAGLDQCCCARGGAAGHAQRPLGGA